MCLHLNETCEKIYLSHVHEIEQKNFVGYHFVAYHIFIFTSILSYTDRHSDRPYIYLYISFGFSARNVCSINYLLYVKYLGKELNKGI